MKSVESAKMDVAKSSYEEEENQVPLGLTQDERNPNEDDEEAGLTRGFDAANTTVVSEIEDGAPTRKQQQQRHVLGRKNEKKKPREGGAATTPGAVPCQGQDDMRSDSRRMLGDKKSNHSRGSGRRLNDAARSSSLQAPPLKPLRGLREPKSANGFSFSNRSTGVVDVDTGAIHQQVLMVGSNKGNNSNNNNSIKHIEPAYLNYITESSAPLSDKNDNLNSHSEPAYLNYVTESSAPLSDNGDNLNSQTENGSQAENDNTPPSSFLAPAPPLRPGNAIHRQQARDPGAYPHRGIDNSGGSSFNDASLQMGYGDGETGDSPHPFEQHSNMSNLAEALPVADNSQYLQEAQPVDKQQATREQTKRKYKRAAVAFLFVSFLVVAISVLAWFLQPGQNTGNETHRDQSNNGTLNSAPEIPLPENLQNLEILYGSLSNKTKLSLLDTTTPQYQAWNWTQHHQNITNLEEWRKQQIFAMVTFFYAFEGPKWPRVFQPNWLDDTMNECDWIGTDPEMIYKWSMQYLDSTEYTLEDHFHCNSEGEIQTLTLTLLLLPGDAKPFVPPEIALLTSLGMFGTPSSQVKAPLVDMLPIELTQLQHLKVVSFFNNGVHGTIPDHVFQFPALQVLQLLMNDLSGTIPNEVPSTSPMKLLYLQNNKLTGTIPTELALFSQLTSLQFWDNSMTGTLPDEIWGMANLTTLFIGQNEFHGTIPTQVGLMVNLMRLDLEQNNHNGTIPSQLGVLTDINTLYLDGNLLTGTIPSVLGLMPDLRLLHLHQNFLTGAIPPQLWQLQNIGNLDLSDIPHLEGEIPDDFCHLRMNESCTYFQSPNSATMPEELECNLGFTCSGTLCGCDCPCAYRNRTGLT